MVKSGPKPRLTSLMAAAIPYLIQGMSLKNIAKKIGVHPVTVSKWKLYNPTFQKAFEEQLNDLNGAMRQKAWFLGSLALKGLKKVLKGDNHSAIVQGARLIFESIGLVRNPDMPLSINLNHIQQSPEQLQLELDRLKQEVLQLDTSQFNVAKPVMDTAPEPIPTATDPPPPPGNSDLV